MGKIRVALVNDFVLTFAGAERVLQALHELYPEAPIYTAAADPDVIRQHFPKATVVTSWLQNSWLRKRPQTLLLAMPHAVESFDFSGYDLVISSSGAFSHGIITGPGTVHISYCHSPMRYAWDWHAEYLREKGIASGSKRWLAEAVISRLRLWDKVSAARVDAWLANSATVAERIAKFYRSSATVVHPPVATEFFDPALTSPKAGTYAVTVSRLTENKRIDLMIRACASLGLELRIGGTGNDRARLERIAAECGGTTIFLGGLTEEEKRDQIAGSRCFLFAAEDDFGIAPVEALALGVPVIAFGRGGATETVRNGETGIFFLEPTAESLAEALRTFQEKGVSKQPADIRKTALAFGEAAFKEGIRNAVDHALAG